MSRQNVYLVAIIAVILVLAILQTILSVVRMSDISGELADLKERLEGSGKQTGPEKKSPANAKPAPGPDDEAQKAIIVRHGAAGRLGVKEGVEETLRKHILPDEQLRAIQQRHAKEATEELLKQHLFRAKDK